MPEDQTSQAIHPQDSSSTEAVRRHRERNRLTQLGLPIPPELESKRKHINPSKPPIKYSSKQSMRRLRERRRLIKEGLPVPPNLQVRVRKQHFDEPEIAPRPMGRPRKVVQPIHASHSDFVVLSD
jgi:hypothetical protein